MSMERRPTWTPFSKNTSSSMWTNRNSAVHHSCRLSYWHFWNWEFSASIAWTLGCMVPPDSKKLIRTRFEFDFGAAEFRVSLSSFGFSKSLSAVVSMVSHPKAKKQVHQNTLFIVVTNQIPSHVVLNADLQLPSNHVIPQGVESD